MSENNEPKRIKVWDPVVRIGHWVIVAGVLIAYLAGDDAKGIHVIAGYVVAGAVLIRILWGLIGTRHARFASFPVRFSSVAGYLGGLLRGKAPRYIGHNPAGSVMIIALLFSLVMTTGSGLILYAMEDGKGPLAPVIAQKETTTSAEIPVLRAEHDEDDDEADEYGRESAGEELVEGLHQSFTYITLALAGLHIIGVVVSSRAHGENLVRAMITGRKKA